MSGDTTRRRAAEEAAFVHRAARMIVEQRDDQAIVDEWRRFADDTRGRSADPAATHRELCSVLVAVLFEARRMAEAGVDAARRALADALDRTPGSPAEDESEAQFRIQDLMSEYNSMSATASAVLDKIDCIAGSVIKNIG